MNCFVIRDLPYLKLLHPICVEFIGRQIPYNLYCMDCYRSEKEYNRASIRNVELSSSIILNGANKVKTFKDDSELLMHLRTDKIKKLISVEISLWAKGMVSIFNSNGIKTYSILYFTDSYFSSSPVFYKISRTYHTTKFLLDKKLANDNVLNNGNHLFLGSPLFDEKMGSVGDNMTVFMPNLSEKDVANAFGSKAKFISALEKICNNRKVIFKTRRKQWLPREIKNISSDIVEDGCTMYPSKSSEILKKSNSSVLFYSSGVYECVYSDNRVINIPFPLNRWKWDQKKLNDYFKSALYNFNGVVDNFSLDCILRKDFLVNHDTIDEKMAESWKDKYIGKIKEKSYKLITNDIMEN